MSVALGISLGLVAALFAEHWIGRTIMAASIAGFSLPTFWVGTLLVMVFGVSLGWLPAIGRGQTATILEISSSLFTLDGLAHIILPASTLALGNTALIIRVTRSGAVEALQSEFVRFARFTGDTQSFPHIWCEGVATVQIAIKQKGFDNLLASYQTVVIHPSFRERSETASRKPVARRNTAPASTTPASPISPNDAHAT